MKKGQFYCIHWEDTFSFIRWSDIQEIEDIAKKSSGYIKSVGFYLGEFHGMVALSGSFNTNPTMADWGMITYIPKGTIKKIQMLRE